jgi:hypothetical protein
MSHRLIELGYQLSAKRGFFKSIRHSPEFGIAAQIVRRYLGQPDAHDVGL